MNEVGPLKKKKKKNCIKFNAYLTLNSFTKPFTKRSAYKTFICLEEKIIGDFIEKK
jgi:hypothetical protein